jgi:hypothetical protein
MATVKIASLQYALYPPPHEAAGGIAAADALNDGKVDATILGLSSDAPILPVPGAIGIAAGSD